MVAPIITFVVAIGVGFLAWKASAIDTFMDDSNPLAEETSSPAPEEPADEDPAPEEPADEFEDMVAPPSDDDIEAPGDDDFDF